MDYPTAIIIASAIFATVPIIVKLIGGNGKTKLAVFETRLEHIEVTVNTLDKKVDRIILTMPKRRDDGE